MNIKSLLIVLALAQFACVQATPTVTPVGTIGARQEPAPIYEPTETPKPQCAQAITPLHIRADADENAKVLFVLAEGQRVEVLSKLKTWLLVRAGERTGFAKAEFLAECK